MHATPKHVMYCARHPTVSFKHAASGVLSGHFKYRHQHDEASLTRSVLRAFTGNDRANAGVTPPAPLSMSMASMTRRRSRSGAEPALALIVAILQHRMKHSVAAMLCHMLCMRDRYQDPFLQYVYNCRITEALSSVLKMLDHDYNVREQDACNSASRNTVPHLHVC